MSGGFQHINLDYLTRMTDGDRDLQRDLLRTLMKAIRDELARMRELQAAGDWHGLGEVCHRFKTTIVFSGSETMAAANAAIESIAASGSDRERVPGLLAALEADQPRVLAELERALAGLG